MKDSSYLRGHRCFRDLKAAPGEELTALFSVFRGSPGACLIPQGSPVEGLYLIEKGLLKEKKPDGTEQLYSSGHIIGEGALFSPYAASSTFLLLEESRILYLDRSDFFLWRDRRPASLKRLNLPGQLKKAGTKEVLRENKLFWLAKTLPSALFPPLLLARIFLRRRNGVFIEGDRLELRYFRWKALKNTNLTIPLEQIQSVETLQKGLLSRIMKTGHLLVRVNGTEGHVLVKNIPSPHKEQDRILALKRRYIEAAQARKHSKIRRDIARWIQKEKGIDLLEKGGASPQKSSLSEAVFGKSVFVLFKLIWWELILAAACGALFVWGRLNEADWTVLPLIALGALLLYMTYHGVDWANDLYRVKGGMLLDVNRKPLGKEKSQRQAELTAIQNVIAEQKGLWANLFDYGDVKIILPGSEGGILWEGIKSPGRVQERILRERKAWIEAQEEGERQSQQEDMMLYYRYISQELSEKNRS
ncbi:MAG: cyclic nucleotide-binding domain-containing protein [Spirochaetales bacterium]|nr:cyclic nucleotide-binding domain-containing protein [Spirochaetales bacterium]